MNTPTPDDLARRAAEEYCRNGPYIHVLDSTGEFYRLQPEFDAFIAGHRAATERARGEIEKARHESLPLAMAKMVTLERNLDNALAMLTHAEAERDRLKADIVDVVAKQARLQAALDIAVEGLIGGTNKGGVFWREDTLARIAAARTGGTGA